MPERTHEPPDQPSLAPQPNQILATPDTAAQCQAEYGTHQGAAVDQLALARTHGNEQAGTR